MNFSDFAQRLSQAIKGQESTSAFAKTLFEKIIPDRHTDLLKGISKECFKNYYNGKSNITRVARRIKSSLTPKTFRSFISGCNRRTIQEICNIFSDVIEDINRDNAGERLAVLFHKIIMESANKTRQIYKADKNAKNFEEEEEGPQVGIIKDNLLINRGDDETNTRKEYPSLDEQLKELVTVAYKCTVKYRKLMNSNQRTEENEMAVFEALHFSVQDLYFFYEENKGCVEAELALSIVNVYNEFVTSFKKFIDTRNMCRDFSKEVKKTEHCFDKLVITLLENK